VTRGGVPIADRNYANPCAATTDSVTETLPLVTAGVSYLVTAFNVGGVMVSSTRQVPLTTPAPPASAFLVHNGFTRPVNVFLVNGENTGGAFLGVLSPGGASSITIPACFFRAIVSIDPQEVSDHNARFSDNVSSTDVATARTSGPWTRTTSSFALGLSSAGTLVVEV